MEFGLYLLAIIKACLLPALGLSIFVIVNLIEKRQAKKRARAKRQAELRKAKIEYAKLVA